MTTRAIFLQALKNYQAGNFPEAERLLLQILQADAVHAEAWNLRGAIAHQSGRHAQAIENVDRALAGDPANAVYLCNRGEFCRVAGKPEEAIASLEQALRLRPDLVEAHNNLGLALADLGRWDEAAASYRQALRLRPGDADAQNNLGNVFNAQGLNSEAEACYRQALQLQPGYFEAHNNLGNLLKEQDQLPEAIACFQRALQLQPAFAEAHNNLGLTLFEQGQAAEAIACFQEALRLKPDYALAHGNLGNAWKYQGRREEALACYRHALRLQPDHAQTHYNLGTLLLDQGKLEEAAASFQHALRLKPDLAEAHSNLAVTQTKQGNLAEALASYREVVRLRPGDAGAHNSLGNALKNQGQLAEAAASYRQALQLKPDYTEVHFNLANTLLVQGQLDDAAASYHVALRLNPDLAAAHHDLGDIHLDKGRMEKAQQHYHQALKIKASPRTCIRLATMLPPIYSSLDDMRQRRRQFIERLRRLHEEGVTLDLGQESPPSGFYLAYQGFNDRDVQRDLSRLFTPIAEYSQARFRRGPRASPKIKVGFLSSYFYNHAVGRAVSGLIAQLSRRDFSVFVLSMSSVRDEAARVIQGHADHFVEVPLNLPAALRLIRQCDLDVLFFADIGMNPLAYALALHRLAPVQCVHPGHPLTTGIDTIDYFVSSDLMEAPEADQHYTETLVRLKTLPVYYYRPLVPAVLRDRAYFGLPENAHLYACFQTLVKFHPEFDAIIGDILRRDPKGLLLLIHAHDPAWDDLLLKRLARTIPDVVERVRFLPRQGKSDFLNLVALCDVLLDPIHFSGGTTSYESFAVGTPVVTLPSDFMRGRATFAAYKKTGVLDGVAVDAGHYVELAVRLGTDRDFRNAMLSKILAANSNLYEDINAVRELEAFFQRAVESEPEG